MSQEQFARVAQVLYTVTSLLSSSACRNIKQARSFTQRRQSEQELCNLRNYLSNIIDAMPSVLVGVDDQGMVTLWNHLAEQVTGIRFEKSSLPAPGQGVPPACLLR